MADSDLTSRSHNLFRGQVNDKKNFLSKVFVQQCDRANIFFQSFQRRKEFKSIKVNAIKKKKNFIFTANFIFLIDPTHKIKPLKNPPYPNF